MVGSFSWLLKALLTFKRADITSGLFDMTFLFDLVFGGISSFAVSLLACI